MVWQGQYRTAWRLDSCLHTTDVTDDEAWWLSPSLFLGGRRQGESWLSGATTVRIYVRSVLLRVTSTPSVTPSVAWLSPCVSQTLPPSLHTLTFLLSSPPSLSFSLHPLYSSLRRHVSFHPGSSPIWTSTLRFYYDVCVFFSSLELL